MTTSLVRTREATTGDVGALHALYDSCSPDTIERRFHVPLRRVGERRVRELIAPAAGWSIVVEQQRGEVVGHACAAPLSPTRVEIGLLVDDAFQGTGVGTRLMRDLASSATRRGYRSMVCVVAADDEAVQRTVRRAGLVGVVSEDDGLVQIDVLLVPGAEDGLRHPA